MRVLRGEERYKREKADRSAGGDSGMLVRKGDELVPEVGVLGVGG